MQSIIHVLYGDEDETLVELVPERKLFLAVFHRAVTDLFDFDKRNKESALQWFSRRRPINPKQLIIYFDDVKEMFNFSFSRLKRLAEFIEMSERGNDKECNHIRLLFKAKRRTRNSGG